MNFAGIDVGKSSLHLAVDGRPKTRAFHNTPAGRKALRKHLAALTPIRVVLEPTAQYHLLAAKLLASTEGIEVMLANPRATANFAKAKNQRGKSDTLDCVSLAEFAASMRFEQWSPPSESVERLRAIMRRRSQLVTARTQEKVRRKEAKVTGCGADLIEDIEAHITFLDQQVRSLEKRGLKEVKACPELKSWMRLLVSIPGIGNVLAMVVCSEIMHLTKDVTGRQLTAYAGLDPLRHQSGARDKKRRISRRGNKRLRSALYMAATIAAQHSPHVKAWREVRLAKGKQKKVLNVAIARRLLHVIVSLRASNQVWDGDRFHALPVASPATAEGAPRTTRRTGTNQAGSMAVADSAGAPADASEPRKVEQGSEDRRRPNRPTADHSPEDPQGQRISA